MIHVYKEYVWQCLPAAVACSLEHSLGDVLDGVGHDGSEIINPGLKDPYCRRGFHPDEIFDAVLNLGFLSTTVQYDPKTVLLSDKTTKSIWPAHRCTKRFNHYLNNTTGVLIGYTGEKGHAWSYSYGKYIDPDSDGRIMSIKLLFNKKSKWKFSFLMFFTSIPRGTRGLSRD